MAIRNIDGRRIRTTHEFPPIPARKFDWIATDDSTYDGDGHHPMGFGATEQAAIEDLFELLDDDAEGPNEFVHANSQFGMGA